MRWHSYLAPLLLASALPLLANCANGGLFGSSGNDNNTAAADQAPTAAPRNANVAANRPAPSAAMLQDMVNKNVIGMNGQFLGRISRVDTAMNVVDVQLPSGAHAGIYANNLVDGAMTVSAPNITRDQIVGLASRQAGHMVAFE